MSTRSFGLNNIVPTRPGGDSTAACANTRFVNQAVPPVNPVAFGADPTGVNDSTAAFNAAIAVTGSIEFPAGKFRFNSALTYNLPNSLASVMIKGQGADVTILFWPNGSGGLTINYAATNYLSSAHIQDLTFTTGQAAGGTGLTLAGNALTLGTSDIYRVTFRGDDGYNVADYWTTAINSSFITNLNLEGVQVIGIGTNTGAISNQKGVGLNLVGNTGGSQYGVQINVTKSVFSALNVGISYGSFTQGLTVDQSNFTATGVGIQVPGSGTGTLAQLSVTNCQFGMFNTNADGIAIFTAVDNVTITNNYFDVNASASNAAGIALFQNWNFSIVGNQIGSPAVANGGNGIYINTTTPSSGTGAVIGNRVFGFVTGINLDTGSRNTLLSENYVTGNTTPIANAGTNNTIMHNPGYNPVGASSLTPGASPWTYTAGASPETVYVSAATSISSITRGGVQLLPATTAANATVTFDIDPNDAIIITYAGAATANKMVH